MISGKFVDGMAILPIEFRVSTDINLAIDFVVDTGFNDYLTLPQQAVIAMNLPLYSTGTVRLANGSTSVISIHIADISWDNQLI
jgi:clan AA aspartic protease